MRVRAQEDHITLAPSASKVCVNCGATLSPNAHSCAACSALVGMSSASQNPTRAQGVNALASASGVRPAPHVTPWLLRHRWTAAFLGGVTLTLFALIISGLQFAHPTSSTAAQPTAMPTQITATSTPQPKTGFAYYTETVSGFQVQYPANWERIPQNPGIEFDDSAQNPTYILQVLLPTEGTDTNTDWVQYEMNNLRQNSGTTGFQQIPGAQQATIGGVTWTGGAATLQQGATTIAVQVYATVHKDRAYVINMLAANTSLETARAQYFNPIIDTFTFLA